MLKETLGDYQNDGYAVVRQAIPQVEMEPFLNLIREKVDTYARALMAAGTISNLHEDLPFQDRLAVIHDSKELGSLQEWQLPPIGPELKTLMEHPGILNALESQLGPHITCNGDHMLRINLPNSDKTPFRFHQDSQYYGQETRHAHIVTVWLPLVNVNEVNSCLYVIPGSHRWDLIDSARDENGRMRSFEDVEARGEPVPVPMNVGDIMMFTNMTFHGSKMNKSNSVRISIDLRYARTPGTYKANKEVQASEAYMAEKVRRNKRIAPMVVRGDNPAIKKGNANAS